MNNSQTRSPANIKPYDTIALISNEAVRRDLQISDDVAGNVDELVMRFASTVRKIAASRMPRDAADRELEEARSSVTEDIENVLSAGQTERLRQVCWQVQGVAALLDPAMMELLNLSEVQKVNIASVNRSAKEDSLKTSANVSPVGQPTEADWPGETQRQIGQYPYWANANLLSILTESQIELLHNVLGKPVPPKHVDDRSKGS